ncbi:MAG: hypothetical protein IKY83_07410 [Proteobacteria bacterium]|nr:hypothetical protein [Pseudomonadota bacterium]
MKSKILVLFVSLLVCGCAASHQVKEMSAADEARYATAIEEADVKSPSPVEAGDVFVVTTGETAEDALAYIQDTPSVSRKFTVARADYDAFFAQSPAVILARMQLEPVTDGSSLLGYRVRDIKRFEGVDLQQNDIITGIDGVMPRTPDAYFERWEAARKGNRCVVNVQRDLERFELVWEAE